MEPRAFFLNRALGYLRTEKGLTQAQVAYAMGWRQEQVARLEAGERELKHDDFEGLCVVLGTTRARIEQRARSGLECWYRTRPGAPDEYPREGPERVWLVSCSAQKLEHGARADRLYTSPLFELSLQFAHKQASKELSWMKKTKGKLYREERDRRVFILSAKHHLLRPGEYVRPYDLALGKLSASARQAWGLRVLEQLNMQIAPHCTLVMLAGRQYVEPLVRGMKTTQDEAEEWADTLRWMRVKVEEPLRGLGIGQRIAQLQHWLR